MIIHISRRICQLLENVRHNTQNANNNKDKNPSRTTTFTYFLNEQRKIFFYRKIHVREKMSWLSHLPMCHTKCQSAMIGLQLNLLVLSYLFRKKEKKIT